MIVHRCPDALDSLRWLLLVALALAPACGVDAPGGRNIVIITTDTTRADFLGVYGSKLGVTPRLDALAAKGVVYENAYAPMPQTLPSHSTLFTGLSPREHLALENSYQLAEGFPTLAELSSERGYATGAFIGALVLDTETGIQQGFQTFDLPRGVWNEGREGHPPQRIAEQVTAAALKWADNLQPGHPYLLWAHYYDPHGDSSKGFTPPARHRAKIDMPALRAQMAQSESLSDDLPQGARTEFWAQYAAEVRYTDEQVGLLLDGLEQRGLMKDTLVAVVGDHGEGLYEHGVKAHGVYVWESLHRIPMILVHPDGEHAGRRVSGRAALRDVAPTLKQLAMGIEFPAGAGMSVDLWSPLAGAEAQLPERPVFLERPHYSEDLVKRRIKGVDLTKDNAYGYLTAVLMGQHKLIRHPDGSSRLYDLSADPEELVDLAASEPALLANMEGLLADWMEANEVGLPGEGTELSPEREAALRALGYL